MRLQVNHDFSLTVLLVAAHLSRHQIQEWVSMRGAQKWVMEESERHVWPGLGRRLLTLAGGGVCEHRVCQTARSSLKWDPF